MWNWHWQAPADYGQKYDVGLIEVHKKTIADWREHNQRKPSTGYIASLLMRYREMVSEMPEGSVILNQEVFLRQPRRQDWGLGETGQWQLTRGGVAACWAIDYAAREHDTIVLVGFDVIKAGIALPVKDAFSPEYQASSGFWGIGIYEEGKTKEGNHDYPAERNLLHFLAERKAVNLVYAEDFWP